MIQEIEEKIMWIFILLPGFLSTTIIGQIIDLGQLTEFQIIFYSFVLTLVDICIALFVCWLIYCLINSFRRGNLSAEAKKRIFYVTILISAIFTGVFFGMAAEKDMFFLTLRSLPITDTLNKRSSSRPLSFLLSQNTTGQLKVDGDARPKKMKKATAWLKVKLKSKKQYEGWPEYYGVGSKPTELYLSPACEWKIKNTVEIIDPIPGPGVLIFEREIETITFIDEEKSKCYDYYRKRAKN